MKGDGNIVETFFLVIFVTLAFIFRGIGFAGKQLLKCFVGACHLVVAGEKWMKNRNEAVVPTTTFTEEPQTQFAQTEAPPDTAASALSYLAPRAVMPSGGSTTQTLRSVADCHVNVVFNDSFTASVSLHSQEGLTRRKMRAVSDAAGLVMREAYGRETWDLPDFELKNGLTIEDAILDTERIGTTFLKGLLAGNTPAAELAAVKAATQSVQPHVDEQAVQRALAILRGDAAVPQGTSQSGPGPAIRPAITADSGTTMRVRRSREDVTRGVVVECGQRALIWNAKAGQEGEQGTTFEAILETEDSSTASFRGVRLQEQFDQLEVRVGDLVEITSLGRTKVEFGGGKVMRNEFRVQVLERAAQRV